MKKNFIPALLFCIALGRLQAQDIHFSQFYMSPLTENPALAGARHDMQALVNYKDQWQSVGSTFKTVACSYDMRLRPKNSQGNFLAAGVSFYSDKAGDAKTGTTEGALSIAYHLYLGEHNRLGAGIQAGYAQRSMNYSAFQWGNQYDVNAFNPNLPSGEPSAGAAFGYADFGTGIVWTYENASRSDQVANNHELKINLGAGFFHVNQPAYSFYKTPGEKLYMRTSIHGSAIIGIPYSSFSLVPGFMYSMQGTAREIYAGTMIRYTTVRTDVKYGNLQGTALSLGAYLRTKDAVAAVMMLEYSSFAAGFSYDFNVSTLKAASSRQGGFEIALRYVFPDPFSFRSSGQSFY